MKTVDNQQSEFNVRPIRQKLVHALFAGELASTRDESRHIPYSVIALIIITLCG